MMSPLHRLQCIVQSLYSALSASTPTSTLAPFPSFLFFSFSVSDRAPFPSLSSSFCSISSPFYAVVPFSSFFAAPRPQTHSETEIVRMHSQSHCHGAFAFFSTICLLDTVAFGIWSDHDQSRCLYPSAGAWTFDDDDIRRWTRTPTTCYFSNESRQQSLKKCDSNKHLMLFPGWWLAPEYHRSTSE